MKTFIKLWIFVSFLTLSLLTMSMDDTPDEIEKDYTCMVYNLHYEARGEGSKGLIAVANVVMNRTKNPAFPYNVCGVVYQHKQFSWVQSNRHIQKIPLGKISERVKFIAYEAVVNKTLRDNTNGALYFHASGITTAWNKIKTVRIGNHIFYK